MRWIPIACAIVLFTHEAAAAPVFDDQRGQARDAFRDFAGVDLLAPETTGVANDSAATLVRLTNVNTLGSILTQPYEPLSASAWKKVYLSYTAAAANDIALAIHDADGVFISAVPLTPTSQPGFRAEADLSSFDLTTHPNLRFAITLDGVGAPFAPTLDDLLVTWSPVARLDLGAVSRASVCAGDTFTIDVPVSVSFVRADGLGVKVDKPVATNNTHPIGDLEVISVSHAQSPTNPGRVANTTRFFDALRIDSGDVFWTFNGPVAAGTSLVLSVTYRVPGGIDNGTRFTTRAWADATNAALTTSNDLVLTADATPEARITVGHTTVYTANDTVFANQDETITAHVRVDNARGTPCGQTLHDLLIVDQLDTFVGTGPAYIPPPSAISHDGVYVAANTTSTFLGRAVNGPAVVWTLDTLLPHAFVERSYRLTLESNGNLADGATPTRRAYVVSTFDGTAAQHVGGITVGLPDQPNGNFAIGQKYLGQSEVNALRDDLGSLVIPSGSAFTYVLHGQNNGLSSLDDVYMYLPIPDGLDLLDVAAPDHADIFFNDAPIGSTAPDVIAGMLGPSWVADPSELVGPPRWVAARATLASAYFGASGPTSMTVDIDVVESSVGGGCEPAVYDAVALFSATAYTPVGETTPVPHGGSVTDNELVRTAPSQPRIHDFQVARDVGQRVGAGPITYSIRVANDGSSIDSIDLGRNAVLVIDLPRVELVDGPGYLPLVSVNPRDGIADTSDLANGKVTVRWATLPARSSRDVGLVLDWPAGSIDGATAELRANLTVQDDVCSPRFASGAATTTLLVRPALTVDKVVDLDAATPGSFVTYTITATNDGDGAATNPLVFDRLPSGLALDRVIGTGLGGIVYVSNALPPVLPANYTNLAELGRSLVDTHFVPALLQGDGSWISPLTNTTWVAIELDDLSLTPPRLPSGREATVQIIATIDELPAQSVINNRAAVDADIVNAAVSRVGRTLVSGAPTARITRTMPTVVVSDEVFTYTVAIANTGTVTATSLTLAESLPPGVTYVGSTFAWNAVSSGPVLTPTIVGSTLTWDLGANVGSLQGGTATITVRADSDLETGDALPFTSTATITNPANPTGSTVASSSIVRVSTADLVAAVTLDREDPIAGDRLSATLVITNQGEHFADGTGFTLRVPASLGYVSGSTRVTGYDLGEPTVVPILEGAETVAYDLIWTDLTRTGQPIGRVLGDSGPITINLELDVALGTPPGTDLPVTLTAATSTGQGGATENDTATFTARTPEADPNVHLIAPTAVKPGDTAAVTVRYGNDTRQPAGPSTIVVTVPSDVTPNTFVRATATHGETLYYFVGTPGAALTLPADPTNNGWTTAPSAAVTHVGIVAPGIPGNTSHDVTLETRFVSPDGDLVSGGTHHEVHAVITSGSDGDPSDNEANTTIDVPGLNLTATLSASPSGTYPGVVVGGAVTHTATVTNTGLAASFGTFFTFDRGALTDTSTLPTYADISAIGPNGASLTERIPLTVDGNRILIGTNGGASDPLDYRNIGMRPNGSLTLVFTGTVPDGTTSGTNFAATFTVGSDYAYDHNPNADPELATDNVAVATVTAYRPDIVVAMSATDEAGATDPVARGEWVIWTVAYNNVGDIAAADTTLISTVASGTAFVVGSITDAPAGFAIEYLGPSGWGYTPTSADGTIDPAVRAVRMTGSDLATPLNPSYVASATALAAGTTGNSRFADGRVSATTDDGDTWTSEIISAADLAQWTRVSFADRQGDDPMFVTVLDGNGVPIAGYENVPVDASSTIDISGLDPATHDALQFQVTLSGASPVCDLAAGRGVTIDANGGTSPFRTAFHDTGIALQQSSMPAIRDGQFVVYRESGGTWTPVSPAPGANVQVTSDTHYAASYVEYPNFPIGVIRLTGWTIGVTGYPTIQFPWLTTNFWTPIEADWHIPGSTTYPTHWNQLGESLVATSMVPGPDLDPGPGFLRKALPYLLRFTGATASTEALPVLDADAVHDFDGQSYRVDDAVFGRERNGRAIAWSRVNGTWSATAIERPLDAIGDPRVRSGLDTAEACVDFMLPTGRVAYHVTAQGVATAVPLPVGTVSGGCGAPLGAGLFTIEVDADYAIFDATTGVTTALPASSGTTIVERAGGNGAERAWILGVEGTNAYVWTSDAGTYTRHLVASDAVKVYGLDAQGVVYLDNATGFVAIDMSTAGVGATTSMLPAGWAPMIEVRQLREGLFVGLTTRTGDVQGFASVTYDRNSQIVASFFEPGVRRPNEVFGRVGVGSWVGGSIYTDLSTSTQHAALWAPTGDGTDGWSPTLLPQLPGNTSQNVVLGMNHEDPTTVVGQSGSMLVSWTKEAGEWTVHEIHSTGVDGVQGAYYPSRSDAAFPVLKTYQGFLYYDATSATGVRLLDWYRYQSDPSFGMSWSTNGFFTPQYDTGVPMFVTGGARNGQPTCGIVLYYSGDTLTADCLPGEGWAEAAHSRKPIVAGYTNDGNGQPRATVWTRVDGTWVQEQIAHAGTYANLVMDDESIVYYDSATGKNGFAQKRDGVWHLYPFGFSIGYDAQRIASLDNFVLAVLNANGNSTLVAARPPRPGETDFKRIDIAQTYDSALGTLATPYAQNGYFDDGMVIGTRRTAGVDRLTRWQIHPDDTVTEHLIDPSGTYTWMWSSNYYYAPNKKAYPVRNQSNQTLLWVPRANGDVIVDPYPPGYSGNRADILAAANADLFVYSNWAQRLAYGCWMASDASFSGFSVGYRTGTPPSYSFRTEVLGDTCLSTLEGETTASTVDPDSDTSNDVDEASIAFERAELNATLTASHAVAPVGTTVTYTATIINLGPATATGVNARFTQPDGTFVDVPLGALSLGATQSLPFTHVIDVGADGTVINAVLEVSASTADCDPDNDGASAATIVSNMPNVWVELEGPPTALIGVPFALTVHYGNDGAVSTTEGTIDLQLPPGLSFVDANDGTLVVPELDAGDSDTATVMVVASPTLNGQSATTSANIVVSGDVLGGDDLAFATTSFTDAGGLLAVSIHADHGSVGPGDRVGFAVLFENQGQSAASGSTLVVNLPPGAYIADSSTGTYDPTAHTLTWALGDFPVGHNGGVSFALTGVGTSLAAAATLSAALAQPAGASTTVPVNSGVHVSASVDRLHVGGGATVGQLQWTVLVHNDGAETTVALSDLVPAGTSYVAGSISGPGASAVSAPELSWSFPLGNGETRTLHFATTAPADDAAFLPTDGNIAPVVARNEALPTLVTTTGAEWILVGESLAVTISYINHGPAVSNAMLRQSVGDALTVVNPGSGTLDGSTLTWGLGDLVSGATGNVTFTVTADSAGPFVVERANLTSSGVPQLSNDVFGVAVEPCDEGLCELSIAVPNEGCVTTAALDGTVIDLLTCGDGACAATAPVICLGGVATGTCTPGEPGTETCNGEDDDCDNAIDEELTRETTCGVGACAGTVGTETCTNGDWGGDDCDPDAAAGIETCNGDDDDCDGFIDEDLLATSESCTLDGGCAGVMSVVCLDGAAVQSGECVLAEAIADICNGDDDDCDGDTDEDFIAASVSCGSGACGVSQGLTSCVGGVLGTTCDPLWSGIPDTTCGSGSTGLNAIYLVVTNAVGEPIGSVRCFQDLGAPNTPVVCDTKPNSTELVVNPALLCEGVAP